MSAAISGDEEHLMVVPSYIAPNTPLPTFPPLSAKTPRLLHQPGHCHCSNHEIGEDDTSNSIAGYALRCADCTWTMKELVKATFDSFNRNPVPHEHYQLCQWCYEKGWEWHQHRKNHKFLVIPPSEAKLQPLLSLPIPANNQMSPQQKQESLFGKKVQLYYYQDNATTVVVSDTFDSLIYENRVDAVVATFRSSISISYLAGFGEDWASFSEKVKFEAPSPYDTIARYTPSIDLSLTSVIPMLARLQQQLVHTLRSEKKESSKAIRFCLFDISANQSDQTWLGGQWYTELSSMLTYCKKLTIDPYVSLQKAGGILLVPAHKNKAALPRKERQFVWSDCYVTRSKIEDRHLYMNNSDYWYLPSASNLKPLEITDLIKWIYDHLSAQGKELFDLPRMLKLVEPFHYHFRLLNRIEMLVTHFSHAFHNRFREIRSPASLIEYRPDLYKLTCIVGLHQPLEQLNITECESLLIKLENVIKVWLNDPAIIEQDQLAHDTAHLNWQTTILAPIPFTVHRTSQPRHVNDGLYNPQSIPAARKLIIEDQGLPMYDQRAEHSYWLSLVSQNDVGTKYVVSSNFEEIVFNPTKSVFLVFCNIVKAFSWDHLINLDQYCKYTSIHLSMITTLNRIILQQEHNSNESQQKEQLIEFGIFDLGYAVFDDSPTAPFCSNEMQENWMNPIDYQSICTRSRFVLYPAGNKPLYDSWNFYRIFPFESLPLSLIDAPADRYCDECRSARLEPSYFTSMTDYYCKSNLNYYSSIENTVSLSKLVEWLYQHSPIHPFDLQSVLFRSKVVDPLLQVALVYYRLLMEFKTTELLDKSIYKKKSLQTTDKAVRVHLPPYTTLEALDINFFNSANVLEYKHTLEQTRLKLTEEHKKNHRRLQKKDQELKKKREAIAARNKPKGGSIRSRKIPKTYSADFLMGDGYVLVENEEKQKRIKEILSLMDKSIHNRWLSSSIIPLAGRLTIYIKSTSSQSHQSTSSDEKSSKQSELVSSATIDSSESAWCLVIEIYCINGDVFQPDTQIEVCQSSTSNNSNEDEKMPEDLEQDNYDSEEGIITDGEKSFIYIDNKTDEPNFVNPAATDILIRGQRREIEHTKSWYHARGVELPESIKLTNSKKAKIPVQYLYAALLHDYRSSMMLNEKEIKCYLPYMGKNKVKLIELDDWYIGPVENLSNKNEFTPSSVITFQLLAQCIVEESIEPYMAAIGNGEIPEGNISKVREWHEAWFI